MNPYRTITEEIRETGFIPPEQGDRDDIAWSALIDAIRGMKAAVQELASHTDTAVLLTSDNIYLRKLGEQHAEED